MLFCGAVEADRPVADLGDDVEQVLVLLLDQRCPIRKAALDAVHAAVELCDVLALHVVVALQLRQRLAR